MILSIIMPTYSLLVFEMTKIRNSIQSGMELFSMTKIPPDDFLQGLYNLRIRESEKLKTLLELYDLEIHQKKLGPENHRLKTMVKRSIEQEIRNKNSGARNGNYEKNAVVKNQGTTACTKNSWRLLAMGIQRAVFHPKGDNCSFRHDFNKHAKITQSNTLLSCSRMSEKHREPEVAEEEVPVVECLDGLARITLEELQSLIL